MTARNVTAIVIGSMKMLKKIKSFLSKDVPGLEKLDVSKRWPGYVDKRITWAVLFLMLLVVGYDFVLNDYSFRSVSVSCPLDASGLYNWESGLATPRPCVNPFYICQAGEYLDCRLEAPIFAYEHNLTDLKMLPPGFKVGRDDWLAKNGSWLLLSALPLIFVFNHVGYVLRTGNWRYKKDAK